MSQPILNIKMVPGGVDLVVRALMQMPYGDVAVLIAEIRGQADEQLQAIQPEEPTTESDAEDLCKPEE